MEKEKKQKTGMRWLSLRQNIKQKLFIVQYYKMYTKICKDFI